MEQIVPEHLGRDPHRPRYHFLPPANWLNDPNGLIHWKGQYHLFYQYNPNGPFWGTIHWGHAASTDLVHWMHLPIALTPTPESADEDGCWSGCAIDNHGIPTLIYTGKRGEEEFPCFATSPDDLLTWQKYGANPVIPGPPSDLQVVGFRDPSVWREGDKWYQLIGSGIPDVGGTALLYTSPDLIHWEYMHPLYTGDKNRTDAVWTGSMWECPQLFPLGEKHVLLVSVSEHGRPYYAVYFVGRYVNHRFLPETQCIVDGGRHFYAPQTLRDDRGRRLMWGWLWEGRSIAQQQAAGWAGVMSLPRLLRLRPDGLLAITPVPEVAVLRGTQYRYSDMTLTPTSSHVLPDVQGDCLEILATFELGDASTCGIKVRCAPNSAEETLIVYDRAARRLSLDQSRSSLNPAVQQQVYAGPDELADEEPLKLHIFLDRSVVEIFANDRTCLTGRIYPTRADSLGVDLFADDGTVKLTSMDIWKMGSASVKSFVAR